MIRKDGRTDVLVECDECGTEGEPWGNDQFSEMIAALKKEGWIIRKGEDGVWNHYCPDPECSPDGDTDGW